MALRKLPLMLLFAIATWIGGLASVAQAADPAFVGILALAADDDVATQLGLTDEVREKLNALIKKREDEAVELVLSSRTLPAEEKAAKVKAFMVESEKAGLALLTDEQRGKLEQARIARAGLSTLGETKVAESLKLTEAQKADVKKQLDQLATEMARGTDRERQIAKGRTERALVGLLTKDQRTAWENLAGQSGILPMPVGESEEPGDDPAADPSKVADAKPGDTKVATNPAGDGKLKFNFRFAPWKDVLDWFAKQAGMSLQAEVTPPGTFNYIDSRSYTPGEAIDLLNGILVTKGFLLVRRERMLILLNLEDEIPDLLIDTILPDELDTRGKYELVNCLFPIKRMTPEDAEKEVNKLKGPFGKVVLLPQVRQLQVREMGGKLRAIREMLASVENPEQNPREKQIIIRLEHITTDEFMFYARPMMGMAEGVNAMPDGSLRLAPDPLNARVLVTGRPDRVERIEELLKMLDVTSEKTESAAAPPEQPQIEVYPPGGADPVAILQVMQTLIGALPDVRMATDPKTGNLVALARPSQHATIREVLKQLQKDVSSIEVFHLRRVDPQLATVTINKLFGGDDKGASAGGPRVENDSTSRLLIVRGTPAQVAQVRALLEKMGEGENLSVGTDTTPVDRGNVRSIPLSGKEAERVLDQLEALWPTVRSNRIRVVRPSAKPPADNAAPNDSGASLGPTKATPDQLRGPTAHRLDAVVREPKTRPVTKPTGAADVGPGAGNFGGGEFPPGAQGFPGAPPVTAPGAQPAAPPAQETPAAPAPTSPTGKEARRNHGGSANQRFAFISTTATEDPPATPASKAPAAQPTPAASSTNRAAGQADAAKSADGKSSDAQGAEAKTSGDEAKASKPGADIVITIQRGGIVIASEDKKALDELESLFMTLVDKSALGGTQREYTVYYLRHAKAEAAAALLNTIITGGGSDSSSSGGGAGGGGLFGDLAAGMMGDMAGGLFGNLLGGGGAGGGSSTASGPVTITPDARLNALIIKASANDLELVEELLRVIDQEASPEPDQTAGTPRFIPVMHTSAEEVAGIVRTVFANRIQADSSQPRQPSPEDLVRALRGGRGGGGQQQAKSEPTKMTIGVDVRSNSLIVSAPEPLFNEVKNLVNSLDMAASATRDESLKIVTVKAANPLVLQRALQSMGGPTVRVNNATATGQVGGFNQPNSIRPMGGQNQPQGQPGFDAMNNAMQQQFEMMQRGGGGRGGGGQGFGGRGGGGFPGGGGGFPGGGGGFPGGGGGFGGRGGGGGGRGGR